MCPLVNPLVGLKRHIESNGDAARGAEEEEGVNQLRVDSATAAKQAVR